VDSRDFGFLYRKEFIILCLLLLGVSFAQIASEQQLSIGTPVSGIIPIFVLRNMIFEAIGIFLPLLAVVYLFFQKASKDTKGRSFPLKRYVIVFTAIFILMLAIAVPSLSEEEEEEIPENNTITLTSTIPSTNPTSSENPSTVTIPSYEYPSINSQLSADLLNMATNALIFMILFLPLLIIFLIRYRSQPDSEDVIDDEETELTEVERTHLARSILECYYQASTKLEENGADKSPAFTPIEFLKDVIDKKLIPRKDIDELTKLFEEAKFSENEMTNEQLKIAKNIARSIIFAQEERIRNSIIKSKQKSKEGNQ
jgi:heme/copper-type cytochrome/quinol oxidase subunit 2